MELFVQLSNGKKHINMNIAKPSTMAMDKLLTIAHKVYKNKQIKVVFEFGARYGEDTIEFAQRLPHSQIYTFECNEQTIPQCRDLIKQFSNITLTEKAICESDGPITFYPIDAKKTTTTWKDGNQGASSLLKASGKYPIENYVQDEKIVSGITLKTFMQENDINKIDIMWMDIQGAELMALKGLQDRISDVGIFHIEVEFFEIYSRQPLFKDLRNYLESKGFEFKGFTTKSEYSADAIFINRDLISMDVNKLCHELLIVDEKHGNENVTKKICRKIIKKIHHIFDKETGI